MAAPSILSPGSKVGGKYEVVEVIGFGGMGVVYKVREQVGAVSRIRALKTVLPQYASDKAVAARFRQEAEKMCLLEHENIVPVLSYSEEAEFPYLVMPFIEGQTLKEYLSAHVADHGRGLPLAEVMEIGLEIVRGLEVAHRFVHPETQRPQPMVHRDIKPGNIMVRVDNRAGERRIKVLIMDFGIAKVLSGEDTGHTLTEVIGTVKYASPEQVRRGRDIDPRADIYSLGMVLYELYCGRHLFAGLPEHTVLMRMMQKDVADHDVTFPEGTPERFRQLILRSVAADREMRFANVGEMRAIMRRILDEDAERAANDAQYAAEFAESERKRAEEHEAPRLAATLFTDADGKLAEGRAARSERRFARATELLREAAEAFSRAIDAAVEAREHERLRGARMGLSELEARARAANAAELAAAEMAAAARAAELFDKAFADGDLSVARRELAHAERALREAETLAQREAARREAADVVAELDRVLSARRAEVARLPAALRAAGGADDIVALEAQAKTARGALQSGDFATATKAARDAIAALAALGARAEQALGDAARDRQRRFDEELASIEARGDLELAADRHRSALATREAAHRQLAERHFAEAAEEFRRGSDGLKVLARELAAARTERDRRLEAEERNRRAEPASREAVAALAQSRARLASLGTPNAAEAAEAAAIAARGAEAEATAAAGEHAAALPLLREAADTLDRLCDSIAARQLRERQSARYQELRRAALDWTRELDRLGADAPTSPDARALAASPADAESQVASGDYAAAIETLERSIPALEALVTNKRAEIERGQREAEARTELAAASDARETARALGERATRTERFTGASAELDVASRALERGDFAAATASSRAATRLFGEVTNEIERIDREQRMTALRERRRTIETQLATLPTTRAVKKARKAIAKSAAKIEAALESENESEATRLTAEAERTVQTLAAEKPSEASTARAGAGTLLPALDRRVAAIGGGAAAAAILGWLLFGRGGTNVEIAQTSKVTASPIARTEPTVEPTAAPREPTAAIPTARPAEPTAAPAEPTVAPPTPVPPTAVPSSPTEPPLAPLSLASARPSGKSITIRVGAQQRFEASLKNAHDAVLVWRVGPDAVGQGETFVFGKPFTETPGKKKVEVVGSRGHGPEVLREWEVEIEAPPLGFGRLDPPTPSLERDVGSRVTFRAPIAQPKGDTLAFQWQVNGETARGIDGSSYEFEPSRPGDYVVAVRATAPWGASIANTWTLSVRQPPPPAPPTPSTRELRPAPDTKTAEAQAQAWIEAYCNAFQTKDTDALIALGHLSNEAEAARLREALKAMTNLRVSCSNQTVRVTGDQAVVSFDRTDHWVDPRGSEMERALPRITKNLRRNGGRWVAVQ